MKAILIRYLACTNHRPARVKLSAQGHKPLIVSADLYDYGNDNHMSAAVAAFFAHNDLQPWTPVFVFGMLQNGDKVAVPRTSSSSWNVVERF